MRRHVIWGSFGTTAESVPGLREAEFASRLDLRAGDDSLLHGIGHVLDDATRLGLAPSETALDLLVLAAHVQAADTRVSRDTESQDSWTRELRLLVPVSDPDRWNSVRNVLLEMLDFLTGDKWEIGFHSRPTGLESLVPPCPEEVGTPEFDGLALFSGGMDSLINAIDELESGAVPLLISHASDPATSSIQQELIEALGRDYSDCELKRLRLWMSMPKDLIAGSPVENSTRGRSFLFLSLGAFAGAGLGREFLLKVPENGLIALNVPMDVTRLGALSTRTTHPFYLARWNELLARLKISGRVENPYWNKTKGEMVAECSNVEFLQQLVPTSMSCSAPTKGRWRGLGIQHCGYCLPCLIRRAALVAGLGQGQDPTVYTLQDLSDHVLDTGQSEGQQVRSLKLAIDRIRRSPESAALLIHKPGSLSDESVDRQDQLAGVYRRGLEEVATLLQGVVARPT